MFPARARNCALLYGVQIDSGAVKVVSPEVKRPGREFNNSLSSGAEVKGGGSVCVPGVVLDY
jgi:hypothetical protein